MRCRRNATMFTIVPLKDVVIFRRSADVIDGILYDFFVLFSQPRQAHCSCCHVVVGLWVESDRGEKLFKVLCNLAQVKTN